MAQHPIMTLTRTMILLPTRREIVRGLAGAGIGLSALRAPDAADAKKGKKKHKKKDKRRKKRKPTPPPPLPDSKPRVDAACLTLSGSGQVAPDGNQRLAQTFTALASGPLVTAQLAIGHYPESVGDYVLRLAPLESSGLPTNGVLAEAVVAGANVLVGTTPVTFTFAAPAPVVAGTQYALVLTRPGQGDNRFAWLGGVASACIGRAFGSLSQTDPFAPIDNHDFYFMTFVIS